MQMIEAVTIYFAISSLWIQGSWVRYPVWPHTFVSPSSFSRRAVVSYWQKYVHEVLVNRLGGLSLPRKSVVRLIDRPDITLDVYRGRKTIIQQQPYGSACRLVDNFENPFSVNVGHFGIGCFKPGHCSLGQFGHGHFTHGCFGPNLKEGKKKCC